MTAVEGERQTAGDSEAGEKQGCLQPGGRRQEDKEAECGSQ